jgi:hypothetical protein
MGLAGVRNADNMMFFEAKKPLVVAYYDVDYTHNAKGSNYWRNRCGRVVNVLHIMCIVGLVCKGKQLHV